MARLAEQCKRYEDILGFLRPLVKEKSLNYTLEERNLLAVCFKNMVENPRKTLRIITAFEMNPENELLVPLLLEYKDRIIAELIKTCHDIIELIKPDTLKLSGEPEERGFFLKMAGDQYRYIAEAC